MDPQQRVAWRLPALRRGADVRILAQDRADLRPLRPDYRSASPDDGPAFFSLCIIAFPLTFMVVWLQVAFTPPWWVHMLVSAPLMILGCLLPLRPIKGWLVASQYVNRAQEAGTEKVWAHLYGNGSGKAFDD